MAEVHFGPSCASFGLYPPWLPGQGSSILGWFPFSGHLSMANHYVVVLNVTSGHIINLLQTPLHQ